MHKASIHSSPARATTSRAIALALGSSALLCAGSAVPDESATGVSSTTQASAPAVSHTHMSEALRSSLDKVVVIAGAVPAKEEITGSYEKATPGLVGGISSGSRVGAPSAQIGVVNVTFPIPILTLPGAIVGGIAGSSQREIQEFRDTLTEDLAQASNRRLTSDGLALDVFRNLQRVPSLEPKLFATTTPMTEDVDAVLYAGIKEITIDVQGKEAILTTIAEATLRRPGDEGELYERTVHYQDRDTLSNWTADGNALWHDYANFAKHYLGREISAEVFDRVELHHELKPQATKSVARVRKDDWQGTSKSTTPTLGWELNLLGGDSYGPWRESLDESDIYYDVEIYDVHRLVYSQKQVPDPSHTLSFEIDACKTYRWSVRPSFHIGSDIKYGQWMRFRPEAEKSIGNGNFGRKASDAPAYIQDFASLKIKC